MNEIIRPTGFDLTKNLHGHVRVETRSRWTGRVVDSQEKDNLVTNAIQKLVYLDAWMGGNGLATWFTPIYEKALGSLILFGDTLTESADNIYLPNKPPIAIAPQGLNADANGGSLNTSESGFTSNGYTHVWDFTTSQANATIKSLGRSFYQLRTNYASSDSVNFGASLSSGTYLTPLFLGYDETNKYLYFAPVSSTSVQGVSFSTNSIYKIKKDLYAIDIENAGVLPARASLVKTLTSSDGGTSAFYWAYDRWKNEFVFINSTKIHHVAIDGTHTEETTSGTSTSDKFVVTENYYWRLSGTKVYRISKTNIADVIEYTLQDSTGVIYPAGNDFVGCGNTGAAALNFCYPDGTIVRWGQTSGPYVASGSVKEVGMMYTMYNGNGYATRRNAYLGTIANLDSPVTKTSSQTMKITYTLTEA